MSSAPSAFVGAVGPRSQKLEAKAINCAARAFKAAVFLSRDTEGRLETIRQAAGELANHFTGGRNHGQIDLLRKARNLARANNLPDDIVKTLSGFADN